MTDREMGMELWRNRFISQQLSKGFESSQYHCLTG